MSTLAHAPTSLPDAHGHFGRFGGMFVPETLMAALKELEHEYLAAKADPAFHRLVRKLMAPADATSTRVPSSVIAPPPDSSLVDGDETLD